MISQQDLEAIRETAGQYDLRSVWLFGSAMEGTHEPNDIDLGVEGITPGRFFELFGKLDRRLSKPVDLVDMNQPRGIVLVIREKGLRIYG